MPNYKLIYNPKAGLKKNLFTIKKAFTLEDIQALLNQYQIKYTAYPTKGPGDAAKLAKSASREGYDGVLGAGGDGTIGEIANGLVGTDLVLGILPLGSFMNICRMLSIPQDLEKAVQLLKIRRIRKIDLGKVSTLNGKKLEKPYYFVESVSVGMEAQLHEIFHQLEKGKISSLAKLFKTLTDYYWQRFHLTLDNNQFKIRASMVSVANGPYSGVALKVAPEAKLNDHLFTVKIYKMNNLELIWHFIKIFGWKKAYTPKAESYNTKYIKIASKKPRVVHMDARVFGTTPIECEIKPDAIKIICGFPISEEEDSLKKRTFIDY